MNTVVLSFIKQRSCYVTSSLRRFSTRQKIERKLGRQYALENFDAHYSRVLGDRWKQARVALLSPRKVCALVNIFSSDLIETEKRLCDMGAVEMSTHTDADESAEPSRLPVSDETYFDDSFRLILPGNTSGGDVFKSFVPATEMISQEEKEKQDLRFDVLPGRNLIGWPHEWRVYTYPAGNLNTFPHPKRCSDGLYDYYLMDAASLLPVVALDIREGDSVFDACAAPGGKSLAILFSQTADSLHCNDVSKARMQRLRNSMNCYIPRSDDDLDLFDTMFFTTRELSNYYARSIDTFDKILLDVPCTNDRHSLQEDENNWFNPHRKSERFELPKEQSKMLAESLKRLKIGGSLVYSTCSLSPLQNDGVVHMALSALQRTSTLMEFVVIDLSTTWKIPDTWFSFDSKLCRYGQLCLPEPTRNFGPMYISRIERIK